MARQDTAMLNRRTLACALASSLACGGAWAQAKPATVAEKPQYGGTLNIGQVYYTVSPLSFDAADWTWKFNQDTGLTYEMLFAADLDKSERKGGKYSFRNDAWIPTDGLRGELAEKWREWRCSCARASCSRPRRA
jgi:peptide/nickel transport system substrate-binding protein